MAFNDKPTDRQLDMFYYWGRWAVPTPELRRAVRWLADNANRKQVSEEMTRIRELYQHRNLERDNFFESEIWTKFKETQHENKQ